MRLRLHTTAAYIRKFSAIEDILNTTGVRLYGACDKRILTPDYSWRPQYIPAVLNVESRCYIRLLNPHTLESLPEAMRIATTARTPRQGVPSGTSVPAPIRHLSLLLIVNLVAFPFGPYYSNVRSVYMAVILPATSSTICGDRS